MIAIQEKDRPRSGFGLSFSPDGDAVHLVYGVHALEAEVAGLTVAEARIAFGEIMNLSPVANAFVAGRRVRSERKLHAGERLVWVKESGKKGSGDELAKLLDRVAASLERIANKLDPPPTDKVGTPYVAEKLACSTIWITELIRKGEIPPGCIVPGTGNGKVWKFYRKRIDDWIASR